MLKGLQEYNYDELTITNQTGLNYLDSKVSYYVVVNEVLEFNKENFSKILSDSTYNNIIKILGIFINEKYDDYKDILKLRYRKCRLLFESDDENLLKILNFFNLVWPQLISKGYIYKDVVINKKN